MADRSAWWRTGAGLAAWVSLVVVAATVAWAAVGVVGDRSDAFDVPLPSAPTGDAPGTPGPSSASPTPRPSGTGGTPSETPRVASKTIGTRGGTVAVSCTGSGIALIYLTPAQGWALDGEDREDGPQRVRVTFTRGDTEVRIRAECRDGSVDEEVETED